MVYLSAQLLPNFFVAGAPKAGTTSLYRYLDQHPEIYMSPIKEPHFFAEEIRIGNFTDETRRRALPCQDAPCLDTSYLDAIRLSPSRTSNDAAGLKTLSGQNTVSG